MFNFEVEVVHNLSSSEIDLEVERVRGHLMAHPGKYYSLAVCILSHGSAEEIMTSDPEVVLFRQEAPPDLLQSRLSGAEGPPANLHCQRLPRLPEQRGGGDDDDDEEEEEEEED